MDTVSRQIVALEALLAQFRDGHAAAAASHADLTRRASLIADLAELSEYDIADIEREAA